MLGAGCPGCGADGAYFVEKAHFCMSFMLWLHEHFDQKKVRVSLPTTTGFWAAICPGTFKAFWEIGDWDVSFGVHWRLESSGRV